MEINGQAELRADASSFTSEGAPQSRSGVSVHLPLLASVFCFCRYLQHSKPQKLQYSDEEHLIAREFLVVSSLVGLATRQMASASKISSQTQKCKGCKWEAFLRAQHYASANLKRLLSVMRLHTCSRCWNTQARDDGTWILKKSFISLCECIQHSNHTNLVAIFALCRTFVAGSHLALPDALCHGFVCRVIGNYSTGSLPGSYFCRFCSE